MIETVCNLLTFLCLLGGAIFLVIGAVGLVRLPDFFTRLHAGGVTETMGVGLILLGLVFQAGWSLALPKVLMILCFLIATSPTACHALAQAAIIDGVKPLTHESSLKESSRKSSN